MACIDAAIAERSSTIFFSQGSAQTSNKGSDSAKSTVLESGKSDSSSTNGNQPYIKYEYLDHTADIQLHSWGSSVKEALENLVLALFDYMTDLNTIEVDISNESGRCIVAEGHDLHSLVFSFLNEWLSNFYSTSFVPKIVRILKLDLSSFNILSEGDGELFDLSKHPQGAEVKAITYSNMKVIEHPLTDAGESRCDIYVVVDI